MKTSTHFFIGKISDPSAKYQIQQASLPNNFFIEILFNGICIWGGSERQFDELYKDVKEILKVIIAAFAFKTKKPLTYYLDNWVEVKDTYVTKNTKNIIGWMFPPHTPLKPYTQRSKNNNEWKKAIWLINNLSKGNGNHVLALKDYYSALTDTSEDSFLFAYRSIEDICRASTGCDEIISSDWEKMHHMLSTNKSMMEQLTAVAEKVRHGNKSNSVVQQAMKNRNVLLEVAYEIIKKEFNRTFPNFL